MARPPAEDPGLPIKLWPCSNGEFLPPPASELVRETVKRADAQASTTARRLGLDRRRFLTTLGASALTLLTLDACSKDERKAKGKDAPAGGYPLDRSTTTEPEAAEGALAGDELIIDVQGHLLDYDLAVPDAGGGFASAFPQADCGEEDSRACFDIEHFLDAMFLRSDSSLVVLSAIPYSSAPDSPLSIDVMEHTRKVVRGLCNDERILMHAEMSPNADDPTPVLDGMDRTLAEHPIIAWKVYTHAQAGRRWSLDDHVSERTPYGEAFLRRTVDLGLPVVCVHKGLSGNDPYASPADIGPAAAKHPDITFVVYHSGYESGNAEGPYDPSLPEGEQKGVDRLLASLDRAGIAAGANVYAELGSTWRMVMGDPDQAAHTLGKLLKRLGPDRVLWGTDSIWYGSPQDQIEAFRAFEISVEAQEKYGYPALTPEVKAKIFGGNAAALHKIEVPSTRCTITRDQLRAMREVAPTAFRTYGPTTTADARALMTHHGFV
jgi:hypothetical protein